MNAFGKAGVPFVFLIDFEKKKPQVWSIDELPSYLHLDIDGHQLHYDEKHPEDQDITIVPHPTSIEVYQKEFEAVKKELNYGNTFLINLCTKTPVDLSHNLQKIFYSARAKYRVLWDDRFVVFSPETFIRIDDGHITTYPMKGTINADLPDAANILQNDLKEVSEHHTIIDLLRNDLSIHARKVVVNKLMYLDKLTTSHKNLYQMSSEIKGKLQTTYQERIGDIIFDMLPAGSVSGAPKKKTVEIIHDVEASDRGYYTGVVGYFDGCNLDSGVMIRYIERDGRDHYYRSGCGITHLSDLHQEYQELIDKIYIPT